MSGAAVTSFLSPPSPHGAPIGQRPTSYPPTHGVHRAVTGGAAWRRFELCGRTHLVDRHLSCHRIRNPAPRQIEDAVRVGVVGQPARRRTSHPGFRYVPAVGTGSSAVLRVVTERTGAVRLSVPRRGERTRRLTLCGLVVDWTTSNRDLGRPRRATPQEHRTANGAEQGEQLRFRPASHDPSQAERSEVPAVDV